MKTYLVRYQTSYQASSFVKGLSKEAEKAYSEEKLAPVPGEVSETSSIHPAVSGEVKSDEGERDVEMMGGIKSDFVRKPGPATETTANKIAGYHC